jgi:hypothetical protein
MGNKCAHYSVLVHQLYDCLLADEVRHTSGPMVDDILNKDGMMNIRRKPDGVASLNLNFWLLL